MLGTKAILYYLGEQDHQTSSKDMKHDISDADIFSMLFIFYCSTLIDGGMFSVIRMERFPFYK